MLTGGAHRPSEKCPPYSARLGACRVGAKDIGACRRWRSGMRRSCYWRRDILNEIKYCGICHSDIPHVRSDWRVETYSLLPGYKITAVVLQLTVLFHMADRLPVNRALRGGNTGQAFSKQLALSFQVIPVAGGLRDDHYTFRQIPTWALDCRLEP